MLTTPILIAALFTGQFSLTAAPAAYDNALPNHTYTLQVVNSGHHAETVNAAFFRATYVGGQCRIESFQPRYGWAAFQGPASFRLRPGQSVKTRVAIHKPPPGQFELVAGFTTRASQHGQVVTRAGVGTAIRTDQPGKTKVKPCPHVEAAAKGGPGVVEVVGLALAGGLVALACAAFYLRRRRHSGATV